MFNTTYQIWLALLEGMGLALSPCILPVLPLVLGSSAAGNSLRPFLIILGFITSFTAFALLARALVSATGIDAASIQTGAFALLLAFGLIMTLPYLEEKFSHLTGKIAGHAQKISATPLSESRYGGFIVGILIGLVWAPCAGPLLAAALVQVVQSGTTAEAAATIIAFSLGAGIPMMIIAMFGHILAQKIRRSAKAAAVLRRIMGVMIILFSIMGLAGFNIGASVSTWTASTFGENVSKTAPGTLQNAIEHPIAAPEISGIDSWINSPPLILGDLKGKVVLIDFWTYSCINCIRTLPHIKDWYAKYKDNGFVVVGIHTPEFTFESAPENVAKAVKKFDIAYPVALDNHFTTWRNFNNQYWPAHYLIDRDGKIIYTHFGEGHYDITENNIRTLLGLDAVAAQHSEQRVSSPGQTPETYLGSARAEHETTADPLPLHGWRLSGQWKRLPQYIESTTGNEMLSLHYKAKKVFVVMESGAGKPLDVRVMDKGTGVEKTIRVDSSELYEIVTRNDFGDGTVTLWATTPGLRCYSFTFEG